MTGHKLFFFCIVFAICMTSCKPELNEKERKVIDKEIPKKLFLQQAREAGIQLGEYLTDGVAEYAEELRTTLQNKINSNNATNALFGGNAFDFGELFGTSTNQIISTQYKEYVNYANRHLTDISQMAEGMTFKLASNPQFIHRFYNEDQEYISMEIFYGLSKVPSTINRNEVNLGAITLDEMDKVDWGEALLGDYKHPKLSVGAVLLASILAVEDLSVPKPVYTVYDEETKSWETGYDSGQALSIKFTPKGDVVAYEATPIEFQKAYISSKSNVLTNQ